MTTLPEALPTRKIFWENPYQQTLNTTVSGVNGNDITLAATIFFAFAGGQESDHGTLNGLPVAAARKEGQQIIYTLPEGHGLQTGQTVQIEIDWPRRYQLMRLHFAAELVLELVQREWPGIGKIGAHIAADKARIDFAWPATLAPHLPQLASAANAIITADLPILTGFSDQVSERRYWEIAGFSQVACGGTHVQRTAEIGPLRLKRNHIGKGKERIEIYLAAP